MGKLIFSPAQETPKLAKTISNMLLYAAGAWAIFASKSPIKIDEALISEIEHWMLVSTALFRFTAGFFHWQVDIDTPDTDTPNKP